MHSPENENQDSKDAQTDGCNQLLSARERIVVEEIVEK